MGHETLATTIYLGICHSRLVLFRVRPAALLFLEHVFAEVCRDQRPAQEAVRELNG